MITLEALHEIVKDIKADTGEMKEHLKKQNGRIGKLENWRSFTLGASAVINAILIPVVIKMFMER